MRKDGFFTFGLLTILSLLLSSCTATYFHTPNDVYRMNATVRLRNGEQKEGALTILFENGVPVNPYSISLRSKDSGKLEYIQFADVASYVVDGQTYVPKRINLYTAGINYDLFVKRLSDSSAKIQLYELPQARKTSDVGEVTSYYFISVPSYSPNELIELHSTQLLPNFEWKMSEFVSDCPALSAKIKNKQAGYVYQYLSPQYNKPEVMKRIVSEYENCGK